MMQNIFKIPDGVKISLAGHNRLKVTGLSSLPIKQVDDVRCIIRQEKENIISKLTMCQARCRRTGRCFGRAYFIGRAGRGEICNPNLCEWQEYRHKKG